MVKKTINALAYALIAPLAFAQTSTNDCRANDNWLRHRYHV